MDRRILEEQTCVITVDGKQATLNGVIVQLWNEWMLTRFSSKCIFLTVCMQVRSGVKRTMDNFVGEQISQNSLS